MKKYLFLCLSIMFSAFATGSDLIWQMGGDKPIDSSIKLEKTTEWVATPGFGNGLEFHGKGCFAKVDNFPTDKVGDDLTVSFFFKVAKFPEPRENGDQWAGAIFSYQYTWLARVYSRQVVYGGLCNQAGELKGIFSNQTIPAQTWCHFAMVYDTAGKTFTTYLNGERAGLRSDGITPLKKLEGGKFLLGNDPDGCWFNGTLADLRFYNRAFSPKEIKDLARKTEKSFTAKPNFPGLYAFVTEPDSGRPIVPTSYIDEKCLGDTLSFTATPGEYEPASFVLRSVAPVEQVTFAVSDLTAGEAVIPASELDLKLVKCWYQGPAAWRNDAPGKSPAIMVPELLLNDYYLVKVDEEKGINYLRHGRGESATYENVSDTADNNNFWHKLMTVADYPVYDAPTLQPLPLSAGRNQQFFLTLHVPEDARPGLYTGKIDVMSPTGKIAELKVKAEVLPFTLPEARTYYNIDKPYYTSVYYNTVLVDDDRAGITSYFRNAQQIKAELENLKRHGFMYPTCFQLNARYESDSPKYIEMFKKMLQLRKEAGLPNRPIHLISNGKINMSGLTTSPEDLQKLTDKATRYMGYVEEILGHRNVYFYGVDEAKGDVMRAQIPFFEAIRKSGAKTFCAGYRAETIPPGNFAVVGQVQDLLICAAESAREEAAKWHSAGHEIWSYAYPQSGNENPQPFRRNFGLVIYKSNYDGVATFCYYLGFGHPWNDFDSTIQRDMCFAYPTADGVVDTIAYEGAREGYDDVRYASRLKLEAREARRSGNAARIAAADEADEFLEKRNVYLENLSETRAEIIKRILKLLELKK